MGGARQRSGARALHIALEPRMGLAASERLHEALAAGLGRPAVVIDAAAVERMSTPAVLAIAAFLRARGDLPPPAVAPNPSGAFLDAFSELGLFADLMRLEFRA